MSREQFIEYLASRAAGLMIPLHRKGELLGLPRKFHHALAVAHLLDAVGRVAPSGEALRTWYGEAELPSAELARWVLRMVGSLRNADLESLNAKELLAFSTQFHMWGGMAIGLANDKTRK